MTAMAQGAALTLKQAADACGVSHSTVKRRLDRDQFGAAYRDHAGVWRIPVTDLLGAGFHLRGRSVTEDMTEAEPPDQVDRIAALTAELAAERTARVVAEARVVAMAANLDDLRLSLRAITGPPAAPQAPETPEPVPTYAPEPVQRPPEPSRRRWWQRS